MIASKHTLFANKQQPVEEIRPQNALRGLGDGARAVPRRFRNWAVRNADDVMRQWDDVMRQWREALNSRNSRLAPVGGYYHVNDFDNIVLFANRGDDAGTAGRRNISDHENVGGHAIERHVGHSSHWLQDRLKHNSNLDAASSYRNTQIANRAEGAMVTRFRAEIEAWVQSGTGRPLGLKIDMEDPVGIVVQRGRRGTFTVTETSWAYGYIARTNETEHGWYF